MCENCGQESGPGAQVDFLKRYLRDQALKLDRDPQNPDLIEEIDKTRKLIAALDPDGTA